MKRAIISDIHGNLEALTTVLEDIEKQNVDEIICLGDVIGYGANPLECLDLIMEKCKICLIGNHEHGALFDPDGFNGNAMDAILWTREQLSKPSERRDERWEFLNMNPRKYYDENWRALFVHGSPKNPLNEYIFPEDIYNPRKMELLFNLVQHISFQGHTHVPGVFTQDLIFQNPGDINNEIDLLPDHKYLVNVGSVGQPRDFNPNSCYVTAEDSDQGIHLVYHRLEYPVQEAADKIFETPELNNFLGDRLQVGR